MFHPLQLNAALQGGQIPAAQAAVSDEEEEPEESKTAEEPDRAAEQVANGDSDVGGRTATAVETAQTADEASDDELGADDMPEEGWPGTIVCLEIFLLGHHAGKNCRKALDWRSPWAG